MTVKRVPRRRRGRRSGPTGATNAEFEAPRIGQLRWTTPRPTNRFLIAVSPGTVAAPPARRVIAVAPHRALLTLHDLDHAGPAAVRLDHARTQHGQDEDVFIGHVNPEVGED